MTRRLNLMPDESLRRRMASEAIGLWTRVLLVCGVVAAGLALAKAWGHEQSRQRTAALQAQHQPIEQLRGDLKLLQARIAAMQTDEALTLAIASPPPLLAVLASLSDAAGAFGGEAYVREIGYARDCLTAPEGAAPRLRLEGLARDPEAIRRFVDALERSGCFTEVTLGDTEAQLLRGTATTAFEVECTL